MMDDKPHIKWTPLGEHPKSSLISSITIENLCKVGLFLIILIVVYCLEVKVNVIPISFENSTKHLKYTDFENYMEYKNVTEYEELTGSVDNITEYENYTEGGKNITEYKHYTEIIKNNSITEYENYTEGVKNITEYENYTEGVKNITEYENNTEIMKNSNITEYENYTEGVKNLTEYENYTKIIQNSSITEYENYTEGLTNITEYHELQNEIILTSSSKLTTTPPTFIITDPAASSNEFFINTPHCRIPYIEPFSPAIRKLFTPQKYKNCATDPTLISSIYDNNMKQYVLHTNQEAIQKFTNSSDDLSCCYREIMRSGKGANADKTVNYSSCKKFGRYYVLPKTVEYILVDCSLNSKNKLVQQDAFSFVQVKNGKSKTVRKIKPSVLLIGIDSLSRMNFRRTMPNTRKYLLENHWFELEGYSKMGDNTFPNLMELLTGFNESIAYSRCQPKKVNGLDNCDFVWKYFKKFGYHTAYAEDTATISTFDYLKAGFNKPPTDYYLRPLMLAIEKKLKIQKIASLPYCVGRKQYGEYIYDYGLQFANRFKDDNMFGLFWTNSFSHNKFDTSSRMDNKMVYYLNELKNDGILEKSIVFFFSDHGRRWGKLLDLPEGFMEERLPMFYLSLPKWFQTQYPQFVNALKINRNRLASPYDIHMTLIHILQLYEPHEKFPAAEGCKTCQSIFYKIPVNRTCTDAGIKEPWCTCVPYENVSKRNSKVKKITEMVVNEMNKYFKSNNVTSICHTLKLSSIKEAHLKMEEKALKKPNESTYRITYYTKPKEARFQAFPVFNSKTNSIRIQVEQINRLNSYAKDSNCIEGSIMKKYCICK